MAYWDRLEGPQIGMSVRPDGENTEAHVGSVCKAGNYVREEVLSNFIRLVTHTPELQAYTVQKLYAALKADISQDSLTLAAVWVIGEFGDVLLQGGNFEEEDLVREVSIDYIIFSEE